MGHTVKVCTVLGQQYIMIPVSDRDVICQLNYRCNCEVLASIQPYIVYIRTGPQCANKTSNKQNKKTTFKATQPVC